MEKRYSYSGGGISVSWTKNSAGEYREHTLHTHETAEILYFISGKAVFHVEGTEYVPERGDVLFMRPAEAHYISLERGFVYERAVINFDTGIFSSIDPDGKLLTALYERRAGKLNLYKDYRFKNGVHRLCMENMLSGRGDERINITANLILLLNEISKAFSEPAPEQEESDSTEYKVIRYVNKHITERLTLDSVCERFYVSKPQLCRLFKKATGTTMGQYITVKRLVRARQLISEGAKPTAVYSECGFGDYSTFYRAYVKNFGEAPSQRHNK